MSGPPSAIDPLYGARASPAHRVDPAVKLLCLLGFVLAVVVTPVRATWAFPLYGALVIAAAWLAQLPMRSLGRRLLIETPFVLFAVALPFVGRAPHVDVGPLSLSEPGLWAAFGVVVKGGLGAAACIVLAWSTPVTGILSGLERLHVPRVLTAIAGFMVRYVDVVAGELHRMQIARVSRGDDPRWIGQMRAIASTVGTLFVRAFERGERVHHAMLARGFDGHFLPTRGHHPTRPGWWPSAAWPLLAATVAVLAVASTP
jgi:cobalt/nickel transport system permease protein